MLNGTLCACERTLCCILENYQTDKGVNVPEVLRPFVGCDFLPFKEELMPGFKKAKKVKEKKEGDKKEGKKEGKKEKKGDKKEEKKEEDKKEEGKKEEKEEEKLE